MSKLKRVIGVMLLLSMAGLAAEAQTRPVGQTNLQSTRQLLRRIEDRIDLLRNSLNTTTNRSPVYDNRDNNPSVLLTDFEDAVRQLHQAVNSRTSTADDAQLVLDRASALDNFIRQRTVDARTQRYWTNLRVDLNDLARLYGLTWNSSSSYIPSPT